ncbi:type I glyceraldehyde-3-phosphate dehydrogenase [Parendozoicomonas haliclonae]|uniref:D-erythrose-4-phosphate dehydrogenase n=1 Tax=Parendozoicomonas haliclonae TaxID=1960125 RepID=A0A1X7AJJ4_9GAMM|nr:glyceraldehyde 3-phosphate dehydrogenase NAD-binding domain-containing protein [Parendozoicomonas haliclonae]SMA46011.1 D-erythrose-4-phosphate dehydrogenase [Parendozoicomonas haliclonae]
MASRVAINGYGRIGQCVLRALYENNYRKDIQVVAINELADINTIAYLTRYDTTHGRVPFTVDHEGDELIINGQDRIRILREEGPENLSWHEQEIDLLLECSGSFNSRAVAQQHIVSGTPRLLFSQPAQADVDATIVYGVNEELLDLNHQIVSSASCTTNCLVPVLKLLDEHWGISEGTSTTIHSAMNDQPVIDAYHKNDLRLTRSALHSIIPVDTGLAKGIERLLPDLTGRFKALSMRVPTINVSVIDLTVNLKADVTDEQVNALMKQMSLDGRLKGILGYSEEPHASVDFNHDSRSVIIDGTQTMVSGKRMLKMLLWFDNEWGFANRMLDVSRSWLSL